MSILTEEEIERCVTWNGPKNNPFFNRIEFARSIESAVLAKLAGMELPEPSMWLNMEKLAKSSMSYATSIADANFGQRPFAYTPTAGFKALHTAAQLQQAFAQGAASQLSAEPAALPVGS